tara:strand:+ start:165 stop:401 length:237 start_codon:yes stop_codon:yes gene_type:complete
LALVVQLMLMVRIQYSILLLLMVGERVEQQPMALELQVDLVVVVLLTVDQVPPLQELTVVQVVMEQLAVQAVAVVVQL